MIPIILAFQIAAVVPANTDSVLGTIRNYVRVSDRLGTSGQIDSTHIDAIAAQGFDVIINLAPARAEMNAAEAFRVAERGMTYVNIPVSWEEPSQRDLDMFFAVMKANEDRNVFVHCFANMRASAFTYLYRTLGAGVADAVARPAMEAVWKPEADEQWAQWGALIRDAAERYARGHR